MKNLYSKFCALVLVTVTVLLCLCGCFGTEQARRESDGESYVIAVTPPSDGNEIKFCMWNEYKTPINDATFNISCAKPKTPHKNIEYLEVYVYGARDLGSDKTNEFFLFKTEGSFASDRYLRYWVANTATEFEGVGAFSKGTYIYNYVKEVTVPSEVFAYDNGYLYFAFYAKYTGEEKPILHCLSLHKYQREGDNIIFRY